MPPKLPPGRQILRGSSRNPHVEHMIGVAKGSVHSSEPPAINYFGLGRDVYTTRKAVNRHQARYVGSMWVKSVEGNSVDIEHNLHVADSFKEVPESEADRIEAMIVEHFSPLNVKFLRKKR
jgi:hypothetical protein